MANDYWQTPSEVFDAIEKWLNIPFVLDVCATDKNTMCDQFISPYQDALSDNCHWFLPNKSGGAIWMNPPYSNPTPWCKKAEHQSRYHNRIIVGLLPDDRSTRWYRDHIEGKAAIELIPNRRISFIQPETGQRKNGNNKGSIIPIWFPFRTGSTQSVRIEI